MSKLSHGVGGVQKLLKNTDWPPMNADERRFQSAANPAFALTRENQKTSLHSTSHDPVPHYLGAAGGFQVGELYYLSRMKGRKVVGHSEAADAYIHQLAVDFERLGIRELHTHCAAGSTPGLATLFVRGHRRTSVSPES
jgi:hypothetical protein